MSSLDDCGDKPDRSLLELIMLAETRSYNQAQQVSRAAFGTCLYAATYSQPVASFGCAKTAVTRSILHRNTERQRE